jgi:hypothetical protein
MPHVRLECAILTAEFVQLLAGHAKDLRQWCVLMQTLKETLHVSMQRPSRLLRLDGDINSVHATEDAAQ